ncbi:YcxB family protein [Oceanobacillus chungangensis]|uniref:YcxB family protein n=1 Tax=Oceanobacillus chungangensis TaxID=1229152 RepID=UPI00147528C9|nr:YcxB family protein [Oceanobacillus chungangensis]
MFRTQKEYKSDRLIKSDLSYTINKEGINQKVRKSNNYIEWEDIYKFYEKKDMFLAYVSRNKAIILPKRYFNTYDEIVTLKNLVRERLKEKKIKIK